MILEWDSSYSLDLYRDSEQATALKSFLEEVAPNCTRRSSSEFVPIPAHPRGLRPLFHGLHEILTVYFEPGMTGNQRLQFKASNHLYKDESIMYSRQEPHLGLSPWWWMNGLRSSKGQTTVAARFVFYWRNAELEARRKHVPTRFIETAGFDEKQQRIADILGKGFSSARVVGKKSSHFNFQSGPWRN